MGKINKKRTKRKAGNLTTDEDVTTKPATDDLLTSLNISSEVFQSKICDDTKSVRSMKSIKDKLGVKKISKKDKLKLRQKVFLKKISTSNEFKTQLKQEGKQHNGKRFILKDSLPPLGLGFQSVVNIKVPEKKRKPIASATARKNKHVKSVNAYKTLIGNSKMLRDNPVFILDLIGQKLHDGEI